MKTFLISGLACAGLMLALPDTAMAHGGQYRGPGDVVPPNPGGGGRTPGPSGPTTPGPGGPATPGPAGPSTPGPAGPATGGPAGPGAAPGGPTTGGVQIGDDLTRWEFWWEFNKDPFINLREAVHQPGTISASDDFYMGAGRVDVAKDTLKPTETQILEEILPALSRALESTEQRDINSSCMVAMAKIGKDTEQIKILPLFRDRLPNGDQEVRETAALAMGISQMTEAVADLVNLVKDNQAGRDLCKRSEVDDRQRSFAAYGLGLISFATSNNDVKKQAFEALNAILEDDSISDRNVRVAAINGIALVKPDVSSEPGKELFVKCLDALDKYWQKKLGAGEQLIQSHVPPSVAKLFENVDLDEESNTDLAGRLEAFKKDWLAEVQGKSKQDRSQITIVQSAVIALGRTTVPYDNKKDTPKLDREISESLLEYYERGRDQQAQYFSLMALGQIGGEENRTALLKAFAKGSKALEKPWAAISLGVLAYRNYEAMGRRATVDTGIGRALMDELDNLKNPATLAAIAVGLGLTRYQDSADKLREMLEIHKNKDSLAGYICIGLALMGDQRATQQIRDLVATSVRRPERLSQAAIALGKLGDKSAADLLVKLMTEGDQNLAKMSAIASALGFIGDRRTIDPLIKMLQDESLTDISRAFAAVALGGVADKELLVWNSKIAVNMNYRASVETLTNQVSGVLDIL
jgi:HEAT repeat protein